METKMTINRLNVAVYAAIAIFLALFWGGVISHAHADPITQQPSMTGQTGPTADQIREEANGIIGALRSQRDAANDQLAQAMAANTKLSKELEAAKAAKVEPKKDAEK